MSRSSSVPALSAKADVELWRPDETRVQQKGLFPELRISQKHIFHKPDTGDLF